MLIAIVNVIVAQMLPSGVVKGGTALKLRVGERGSRFTPDLDAARGATQTVDDYIREFENRLATGWHGFTATVVRRAPADPENVPADYVMQPFDLKVSYRGKSILTVTFELGHDEIGSTATPTYALADDLADDLADIIVALGFPRPEPVPVLAVEFQVAQKLHACTTPERGGGNARSHDLVDLQILLEPSHSTRPASTTSAVGCSRHDE